ncbi:hypothetical protein [Paenibacillus sp. CECT 9249]|nr:hypothetical protein [Paenibacillus sp. CECT 9249]
MKVFLFTTKEAYVGALDLGGCRFRVVRVMAAAMLPLVCAL